MSAKTPQHLRPSLSRRASSRAPSPPPKTAPAPPPKTAPPTPAKDRAPLRPAPMEYPTRLLHFSELPHWLQDNPSILTSYRPPSYSIPASLRSIFTLHNETVNIATHLFGALLFLLLPLVGLELSSFRTLVSLHGLAPPSYDPAAFRLTWLFASPADAAPFVPFFVGAVICLATSTLFHATSNVSPHVARLGNQLDYVGIACMIAGSTVSSVWFGFVCQPRLQTVYAGMILLLGLGCTVVSLDVRFRTPSWRPFRAGMFIAMGLSGAVPFFHAVRLMGWAETQGRMGAGWAIAQGAMYILGAGLYAARFPERKWPGKFDLVGSSHQIFHVLVVMAAGTHLWGLLRAAEYTREIAACA